jgi:hypothetical protein
MITRRQSLAMTVGAVTTAMVARARSSLAPGSLHELAKLKGMRFGSTMPYDANFPPKPLRDAIAASLAAAPARATRI